MNRRALALLEKLFGLLHVKDVTPLGLSQEYEAQENLPDKVFYVPGDYQRLAMLDFGKARSRIYGRIRTAGLGDSASHPEMLGVSGETASCGLVWMLGIAHEVAA